MWKISASDSGRLYPQTSYQIFVPGFRWETPVPHICYPEYQLIKPTDPEWNCKFLHKMPRNWGMMHYGRNVSYTHNFISTQMW